MYDIYWANLYTATIFEGISVATYVWLLYHVYNDLEMVRTFIIIIQNL